MTNNINQSSDSKNGQQMDQNKDKSKVQGGDKSREASGGSDSNKTDRR